MASDGHTEIMTNSPDAFSSLTTFTEVDNVDEFVGFVARDGEEIADVLARQLEDEELAEDDAAAGDAQSDQ